ncbi:protein kinase [Myxococcota bacterium]|nr:protein kinase [Myxococcota bacterium]
MARYIRNYEVIRELGTGAFGTVYAAVGEVPGRGLSSGKKRLVAIKKLKEGASEGSRQLLRQEFALLDQVKHRGIVRVFEYIEEENAVALEHVHGVTLRKMLDECSRAREQFFTEAAVEIICEIADALYQVYTTPGDNGEPLHLVHRDLKPDNIMVTPQGEVKILDFGLARVGNKDFNQQENDRVKGTPIYMAPEQARGQDVDHRSDLFSVGLIAYELFMNRPAYVLPKNSRDPLGDIFDAIERGVLLDECRELEQKLPAIGPILTKLLAANPKARYQTGQDLLVDLRRQLYRDRGSHLQEFCEFFFGSIYDLPDPPTVKDSGSGAAPSLSTSGGGGGAAGKRLSMEERLKASMAREAEAKKVASKPSSKVGEAKPKVEAWEPVSTRAPKKIEEEKPKKAGPKMIGARSPEETGMLQMMSLNDDLDKDEGGNDPSATAFFAIPAPKEQNRARGSSPPPPGPSSPASPMAPSVLPGPPLAQGPIAQGPVMQQAPPMVQGPIAQGPVMQGPIAQGPVAYSSNTPFQVNQNVAPPPADSGERTQSNRVYAIVLAMFALVGLAIFAAIWFRPQPEPVAKAPEVEKPEEPAPRKGKKQDTAAPPPPVPEAPKPKAPKASGGAPAAPKAPSVPSGSLTVSLPGGGATSVEVTCPSGYRQRASINGGKASFSGVPSDSCMIYFKGGAPAQFGPVRGGQSLKCSIQATTAVCN